MRLFIFKQRSESENFVSIYLEKDSYDFDKNIGVNSTIERFYYAIGMYIGKTRGTVQNMWAIKLKFVARMLIIKSFYQNENKMDQSSGYSTTLDFKIYHIFMIFWAYDRSFLRFRQIVKKFVAFVGKSYKKTQVLLSNQMIIKIVWIFLK